VQSSIISTTTDGVSALDWRSIRRHRTAAAAAGAPRYRPSPVDRPWSPVDADVRPKRKYSRRGPPDAAGGGKPAARVPGRKGRPPSLDPRRPPVASRKRPLHHDSPPAAAAASDDGKNYVKIPGHYQDDFVYYATKRARGRPRMRLQDPASGAAASAPPAARPSAVGGINVFDWYREMAQTDKSTRFGVPSAVEVVGPPESSPGWADTTPVDESAVADLVMDMLPVSSATSASYSATGATSSSTAG